VPVGDEGEGGGGGEEEEKVGNAFNDIFLISLIDCNNGTIPKIAHLGLILRLRSNI
jgi:hypothetical protein